MPSFIGHDARIAPSSTCKTHPELSSKSFAHKFKQFLRAGHHKEKNDGRGLMVFFYLSYGEIDDDGENPRCFGRDYALKTVDLFL